MCSNKGGGYARELRPWVAVAGGVGAGGFHVKKNMRAGHRHSEGKNRARSLGEESGAAAFTREEKLRLWCLLQEEKRCCCDFFGVTSRRIGGRESPGLRGSHVTGIGVRTGPSRNAGVGSWSLLCCEGDGRNQGGFGLEAACNTKDDRVSENQPLGGAVVGLCCGRNRECRGRKAWRRGKGL